MEYQDRTLSCQDCGTGFTFSADDQAYFAQRGFTNEPKRCPSCRANRRDQRDRFGGGSYGYERKMYDVVCAQCGKDTQVPFEPKGIKPVYCSDCFRSQRSGS